MKIIIAGGGTGGHLFPGIAVAEELEARGHEVRFVGTARGIEARVCPRDGWSLDLIDVAGMKGGGVGGLLRGLLRLPRAWWQSRRILKRERPDLVVGVGGYASGPMVLTAWLRGVPTAILEQNSVPGFTNRTLGKLVRAVFGSFTAAQKYFPAAKYRLVGNPVRAKVRAGLALGEAASAPGDGLLIVGGSQGAHAVNELVVEALRLLAARATLPPVTHQTGDKDADDVARRYREAGIAADVRPFIEDMAAAYRAARLVIARAGASTLAELTALGLPALLIPLPTAADDHQTMNARELADAGAARLVPQRETTAAALADAIADLLADAPALARMSTAARTLAHPEAHATIATALEALARRVPAPR